jgi:uracil-DNA glycosylase
MWRMTGGSTISETLEQLAQRVRACRLCCGALPPLPHEPRPVLRVSKTARLLIASQAPGVRVHNSGVPFDDASGERLRSWMGIGRDVFYDATKINIVPMGFCFPGHDASKGDLPPRKECRATWHDSIFAQLPQIETILAIGRYAQDYHFKRLGRPLPKGQSLDATIRAWRDLEGANPRIFALPHPSWRNTGWLKRNPWFEDEVLPVVRAEVARLTND